MKTKMKTTDANKLKLVNRANRSKVVTPPKGSPIIKPKRN